MRMVLAAITLAALAAPAFAAGTPDLHAALLKSCQTQMYLSGGACTCLVAKAEAELDPKQIAYLTIPGSDGPDAAKAAESLSGSEIGRIDKFMRSVPDQCQKGQ